MIIFRCRVMLLAFFAAACNRASIPKSHDVGVDFSAFVEAPENEVSSDFLNLANQASRDAQASANPAPVLANLQITDVLAEQRRDIANFQEADVNRRLERRVDDLEAQQMIDRSRRDTERAFAKHAD